MSKLAQALIEKEKEEKTGYLDLGRCGLTELPDLSGMDWLETLILSDRWWDWEERDWFGNTDEETRNRLTDLDANKLPPFLIKFVFGGDPWYGPWKIGAFEFKENFRKLKTLHLTYCQIYNASFLQRFTDLVTLDLSGNLISDVSFLVKLTNLKALGLNNNRVNGGKVWADLEGITDLDLSSNRLTTGSFLKNLVSLKSLDLNDNLIYSGSFFENLKNLEFLHLRGNPLKNWEIIGKLVKLEFLDIRFNKIESGGFLEPLTNLETLYLSGNKIENGYFFEKLKKIKTLYIGENSLKNWDFLEKLPLLTTLDLGFNKLEECHFLENIRTLQKVYLSLNNLKNGNCINSLTDLKTLVLRSNKIKGIEFLENLTQLEKIDLTDNEIEDITPLIPFLESKSMKLVLKDWFNTEFNEINVKGNPLQNPPLDVVKQGNTAILEYFRQKEKSGTSLLNEAKLILLGDGRAGKTSLANRMLGKELPKEEDRTPGVDIIIGEHTFPLPKDQTFKLHIWDFAGQDKYKPLHQFFYTEGAVYVLVSDSGNAGTDFDDWFQTAQLFGTGSPVLVALNEFRDGVGFGTYDPEHWQKRFPGLLKEHFLVNLKTQKNFEPLKKAIHFQAQNLPHTQVEYPKNWAAVRQELERRRDENFISIKEYLNICKANDLPEKESALVLSGVLHRIGVCLHYQQSPLLRQHVILKNEWATEAVYRILEDQVVAEDKKGFFNWEDLKRIWSDEAYCDMQPQLLELMQQFKMAYPLPNSQEYVAPPLLPPAPPQGWEFPAGQALELFVEYEFLPKALLTQFIVSRHTDIDEGRTLVWRNGVVLRWPDALAQVEKTKSQGRDAFSVRCKGHNPKGLLTAILKTFRDLHSEYKGIKVTEVVPCPCSGCRGGQNKQHYFEFENLKNRLEKGRRVVECDKSLEEVELVRLLGDLLLFEHLTPGQPVVMSQNVGEQAPLKEQVAAPLAYFAYAPEDSAFLAAFQRQLHPLVRSGKIRLWDNNKITAGDEKDATTQKSLQEAEIIFLLLSSDFLSVEAIWELEMKAAIERHEAGKARVIPIKVRSCLWEDTPFGKLQGLPREEVFISNSVDQDEAWREVVKEIKGIIDEWGESK